MLLLWRNSFPRSNKELESEKARGDAFTWQVITSIILFQIFRFNLLMFSKYFTDHDLLQVTLEGRAGALSAMHSFVQNCPELVTDDIIRRLLTPIESALAMLTKYVLFLI